MISIIIPTLNESAALPTTLEALTKNFTHAHEIIISDGASTDDTVAIARRYTKNVVVYGGAARQNIAQGRNAGAAVATGEFFVFLDADCTIQNPDEFFSRACSWFENKNVLGVTVPINVLPRMATAMDRIMEVFIFISIFLQNKILHTGAAQGEFQMIRAATFKKCGGYNEALITCEDIDMFKRLARAGTTIFDSQLTVWHTGRRAHTMGWPKLLWAWVWNWLVYTCTGAPRTREWKPIR